MATNLENLKAKLIELAASLTDELDQLETLALIDDWYACRTALAAFDASDIQSYSMLGRQITKKDAPQLATRAAQLYSDITGRLYGRGVVLVDQSGAYGRGDRL